MKNKNISIKSCYPYPNPDESKICNDLNILCMQPIIDELYRIAEQGPLNISQVISLKTINACIDLKWVKKNNDGKLKLTTSGLSAYGIFSGFQFRIAPPI